MITEAFKTVILLSASGTIMIFLILLLKPFTERKFGAVWQYYIWLTAIAVLLCPFRIKIPSAVPQQASERIYEVIETIQIVQTKTVNLMQEGTVEKSGFSLNLIDIIAVLWFAVTVLVLLYKIICYIFFKRAIYKNSTHVFKKDRVFIRKSSFFSSPLLIGIIKPILIIPESLASQKELNHVLNHELMHYKRCDIAYKWLVSFVRCIHWFNPLVYVLAREVDNECEISCDVLLTKGMALDEKKSYMNTVLSLIERKSKKPFAPFASMASNKRIIKKRFTMIKKSTMTKLYLRLVSVVIALLICGSGILVGSFTTAIPSYAKETVFNNSLTASLFQKDEKPTSFTAESVQEQPSEDEEADLQQNQTVETPQELSKPSDEAPITDIKKNTVSDGSYVTMEIIEFSKNMDANTMTELIKQTGTNYIKGSFNYADGTKKLITNVKPDKNGNITLHLTSSTDEVIQVEFSETDSKKGVWGVRIPAEGDRAYSFTGLDTKKEYSISLYSPAKESWIIDSEYIIY